MMCCLLSFALGQRGDGRGERGEGRVSKGEGCPRGEGRPTWVVCFFLKL